MRLYTFDIGLGSLKGLPGRLILFGLLTAFGSSVGQTFFIALSNSAFRDAYGLSSSQLSLLYGAATMVSAVFMLALGRLIDRIDLRIFALASAAVLAAGAFAVSVGDAVVFLALGLLLLRLGGQGLMSHVAAVSVTRTAGRNRGKATALALLGHALGEATLPILWATTVGLVAWQSGWIVSGIVLLAFYAPVAIFLLPRSAHHVPPPMEVPDEGDMSRPLFADVRFPALLLCAIMPGTIVTAAVFHLQPLTAAMPPGAPDAAFAIPALAAGAVLGGLSSGVLVDRFGGQHVLVGGLVPLLIGCLLFTASDHFVAVAGALACMGAATGAINASAAPAWAEIYGVRHVGRARAVQAFVLVAGTAVGPVLYGLAIDAGLPTPPVMIASAAVTGAAIVVGTVILRRTTQRKTMA